MTRKLIQFGTVVLAVSVLATAAGAEQYASDYNLPYGMNYGADTLGYMPSGRDLNNNRVVVNGMILQGGDLSSVSGAGYMADGASMFGGTPLAIGNQLNVITNGNWNTVIIDSTQINNGDIIANGQ